MRTPLSAENTTVLLLKHCLSKTSNKPPLITSPVFVSDILYIVIRYKRV